MKKRILSFVVLICICFGLVCPLHTQAVTPFEPNADASLTLHYQKEGNAFAGLPIGIYRVAEANPDGLFELLEPFASYPIDIHGITQQEQWRDVAQTLWAYMTANGVTPDYEKLTDETGTVSFSDLDTGLYFVREVMAETSIGTYVFNQFMVYVPTPQPDGTYMYDVEANPKCVSFTPKTQYTVTKLWQDGGNQADRPKEVTVDIFKDGALYETQILNADNNWSYTWYVSDADSGQWTVAEKAVPNGYKVTIRQNDNHFSVINGIQTTPGSPETGDSFTPMPWILLMCFSGIVLMLLGIYSRRKK